MVFQPVFVSRCYVKQWSYNVAKNHTSFTAQHATVPWGFAYEMRNALAHGYFNVDLAIVWQTIQDDLPALKAQVVVLA